MSRYFEEPGFIKTIIRIFFEDGLCRPLFLGVDEL